MIAFVLLLAFELLRNWFVIVVQKLEPNHAKGLALRIIVIAFAAFYKFDLAVTEVVIFSRHYLDIPVTTFVYCFGCGIAFWFPFDVLLNKMRGRDWNHLGRKAVLDRFNMTGNGEWVIKFVLMLVGLFLILSV